MLALAFVAAAMPLAEAGHCETKIHVFGRASPTPLAPPPYTTSAGANCTRTLSLVGMDEHKLPPNTDQVMVRVQGDFGPSIQSLDVAFNGLGFEDIHHTLLRKLNPSGSYSYDLPEWVTLPDGAKDGELTVTVRYPGGLLRSVTYSTTATVVPPPLPPA